MGLYDRGDTKYSLFMRWIVYNAIGLAFAYVAFKSGWANDVIKMDAAYISRGIVAFFFISMANCTWKIWETSRELNIAQEYVQQLRAGNKEACTAIEGKNSRVSRHMSDVRGLSGDGRQSMGDIFEDDLSGNLTGVGYSLLRLSALGAIGMLYGIAVALKVFDVPLTDASQVLTLFNQVPPGLRIAVYPALLAGIAAFWLDFLFQILDDGTRKLVMWVKKAGVYNAEQSRA